MVQIFVANSSSSGGRTGMANTLLTTITGNENDVVNYTFQIIEIIILQLNQSEPVVMTATSP